MARKKVYDDDDGRIIADMSGLEPTSPSFFGRRKKPSRDFVPEKPENNCPWETAQDEFSPEDRRVYVLAALRASLLIAGVFIAGLGLGTWLLLQLWS